MVFNATFKLNNISFILWLFIERDNAHVVNRFKETNIICLFIKQISLILSDMHLKYCGTVC